MGHLTHVPCHITNVTCQMPGVRCLMSGVTSNLQTVRARQLKFWEKVHLLSPVSCHLGHMTCNTWHVKHDMWHMTCDTRHVTHDIFFFFFLSFTGATVDTRQQIWYAGFFLQFYSCWINLVNLTLTPPSMTGIILILSTCCSPGLSWKPPPWVWGTGRVCPPACCSSSRSGPISDCNP